ncbi:MAG: toll/interleukin-1 receptor domain-containing protein [Chloroflexota bacterium]
MSDIDIFVSHATADDTIVSKIHDLLEADGLNVWVDHEDGIEAGDYWAQEIQNAANACEAGLFVMSSRSVDSVYCEAEYQRILARGVILYIVLIEPLPLERIPLRLGTIQYIDLTQDFDTGMTQLINVIKSKRQAPLTETATKQRIKISGTFPRSYLDLSLIGRDDEFEQVQSLLEKILVWCRFWVWVDLAKHALPLILRPKHSFEMVLSGTPFHRRLIYTV